MEKTCPKCGEAFKAARSSQRFCSTLCSNRSKPQARRPEKACEACGETFRPGRSSQRFCSYRCQPKAHLRVDRTCRKCGRTYQGSPGWKSPIHCSPECREAEKVDPAGKCAQCGAGVTRGRKFCSQRCGFLDHLSRHPRPTKAGDFQCAECGETVAVETHYHERRRFCSARCARRCHSRTYNHTRRLRGGTRRSVLITPIILAARDGATCSICGDPVDMALRCPEPGSPTIDHVIPVARGGEHTLDNCKLAHFICNSVKGSKPARDINHLQSTG